MSDQEKIYTEAQARQMRRDSFEHGVRVAISVLRTDEHLRGVNNGGLIRALESLVQEPS